MTPTASSPSIRYGKRTVALDGIGPDPLLLAPACPAPDAPPEELIRRALAEPIGSPPLRELARNKRTAAILVPGKDRVAAVESLLPPILDELNAGGIPDDAITVTVATGTHIRHTDAEIAELLGPGGSRIRARQHDCRDDGELQHVGVTSRGTEVALARHVLEADVKVLTGRIIPHYFAGYGGGRKALLPGVAAYGTILQNHRLTLDPERGIHPEARPGSLRRNPVHLDMLEAARLAGGTTFVVNTLLDLEHRVFHAVAGELEAAHAAGCARAGEIFQVAAPRPADVVITSSGGDPYDCDFVQALKTIFNVQDAVRPGGAILCVAECSEGMKKSFSRWTDQPSLEALERAVRDDYDLAGHNVIKMRHLLENARIALWSELPADEVRPLGIEPVASLEEGIAWLGRPAVDGTVAVVTHANVTHAAAPRA